MKNIKRNEEYKVKEGDTVKQDLLNCGYYRRGECNSCTEIELRYPQQLAQKLEIAQKLIPAQEWLESAASVISGFRNKVKLVVTGTFEEPNLGIIGQDLRNCPLPSSGIREVLPIFADFITRCQLRPYNFQRNSGDLKYLIITESPHGKLMLRFVVRRRGVQGIIRKYLPDLLNQLPELAVVSLNIQPERKAIIEGPEEIILTSGAELEIPLANLGFSLQLRPQSFFQTNTAQAEILYSQAAEWLKGASSAWDLYCGVGGFAFALAHAGINEVVGVETSAEAVASAQINAQHLQKLGLLLTSNDLDYALTPNLEFICADARKWAQEQLNQRNIPEALVVNPPRRGIGKELASWLNDSRITKIVYSSCNIDSMARDLELMPNYFVSQARVVDMFAHSAHFECIALLQLK
ncbi:MAG: methyltransferase domain-containing protein [Arcanobacterium sp.]|nr:methyltransferase domain-containing protein [Arcanobacterium sp.]